MKLKYFLPFALLLQFALPIQAQNIDRANSSYFGYGCLSTSPYTYGYFLANCQNFTAFTDTVEFYIDYGDSSPLDTFYTQVVPSNINSVNVAAANPFHSYSAAGLYTITAIAQFPDNSRDTVIYVDGVTITNTCNNLTGRIYRDNNSNCTFDIGDQVIPYAPVKVWTNDFNAYLLTNTDQNGIYSTSVLQGVNYKINTNVYYNLSQPNILTCSMTDSFAFTANATNVFDYPLQDTSYFLQMSVTDTNQTVCYNSVNGTTYLTGQYLLYSGTTSSVTIQVQLFFGDGNDTTFSSVVPPFASSPLYTGYFYIPHQYPGPGLYSVMMICTDLTSGITDTLLESNLVDFADSCGTISGYYYNDADNSCTYTSGEGIANYGSILVYQNNALITMDFTNANGYYSFDLQPGTYTLDITNSASLYGFSPACSQSTTVTITVPPSTNVVQDFGLDCSASLIDNVAYFTAWGFRPALPAYLYAGNSSINCNPLSGTVTLILDPLTSYAGSCDSTFNPTVNGNVLTWPYTSTVSNSWWSSLNCIELLTDSSAQIGDSVCFTLYLTPNTPDNNPQNDTVYVCYEVRNSYDPNMKEVRVPDMLANGDVLNNRTHEYTVYFQNTGNDVAFDVFILDTLDSHLNPATLQIIGSSHPMEVDYLNGDVLKFDFKNINLPDSFSNEPQSHGWLKYTIAQDANLSPGTLIENTAYIFFDINPAIITNTTVNTIINPTGFAEQVNLPVQVYPVPASSEIQVRFGSDISGTITLMNTLGQSVHTQPLNGNAALIDVRLLPAGVYQLQVLTANGVVSRSVVIQR